MTNPNLPFSRDAYDDLADLFLTEPISVVPPEVTADDALPLPFPGSPAAGEVRPADAPPRVEFPPRLVAMMRVNLPVIAGPWLEQAAAAIAAHAGPVALIRERGEQTTVDLVSGRDGQQAAAAVMSDPVDSLPGAVERFRQIISCWVVEVPGNPQDPPMDCSSFDELVLLTGADEAATVAAFTRIKAICSEAASVPRLSLIIVGSDEDTASSAAARISAACEQSLGRTVKLRAIVRRMQPVPMKHLGRFARNESLVDILAGALRRSAQSPSSAVRAAATTASTPKPAASRPANGRVALPPRLAPVPSSDTAARPGGTRDVLDAAPTGERPACQPADAPDRVAAPRVEAMNAQQSTAASDPRGESGAAGSGAGELLRLLDDLQPLDVECPRATGVEFGFDREGGLHLLTEDDSDASLLRLQVACDWAREHRDLLVRLNPWLASAPRSGQSPITPHLFTSRPRDRRHLADGTLRVHILLRDVQAGGRVVAHLDLN